MALPGIHYLLNTHQHPFKYCAAKSPSFNLIRSCMTCTPMKATKQLVKHCNLKIESHRIGS